MQLEVEAWIRENWLVEAYGQRFVRGPLKLLPGGTYNFNAVSSDRRIAVAVSTSEATTASGKRGAGKMMKVRSDMLFLLMASVDRRIIVFTERDMQELCEDERIKGRVPDEIEFALAEIPRDLALRLRQARQVASVEVTPAE